jgi:hypothetical protein
MVMAMMKGIVYAQAGSAIRRSRRAELEACGRVPSTLEGSGGRVHVGVGVDWGIAGRVHVGVGFGSEGRVQVGVGFSGVGDDVGVQVGASVGVGESASVGNFVGVPDTVGETVKTLVAVDFSLVDVLAGAGVAVDLFVFVAVGVPVAVGACVCVDVAVLTSNPDWVSVNCTAGDSVSWTSEMILSLLCSTMITTTARNNNNSALGTACRPRRKRPQIARGLADFLFIELTSSMATSSGPLAEDVKYRWAR